MVKISIVIRALNEKESLRALLEDARKQSRRADEIVVVDNESTDGTPDVAREYGAKVVTIARNDFSYPRSINMGVEAATGDIVILTVGHARIPRKDFIAVAEKRFSDPSIAGLYAPVLPKHPYSLIEFISYFWPYVWARIVGTFAVEHVGMGVLGATNAAIRRSLWEEHRFDEAYGLGGEDGEWAAWALNKGYKILCDWRFSVRHSHHQGWSDFRKQLRLWRRMAYPSVFTRDAVSFRKDLKL